MKTLAVNTLVGQSVERTEDLRFLTGQGTYVDDLARENALHAAIVRSSIAHGRLVRLDAAAALALPGVRAVLTASDVGDVPTIPLRLAPLPGFDRYLQPVIAKDKVRYVGEPLAVVVADSAAIAEDAVALIDIEIEALVVMADRFAASAGDALLFEPTGSNVAANYKVKMGDADAAFRAADYARRESFRAHRHTAVPMETRGILAEWIDGRLTVSGATKVNFFNRRTLARMLAIPEQAIDMIEVDVGGGFGVRGEFYPEDFLIPFAARAVGRPVKWIEDRREHLLTINHSREVDCEVEIACRDGLIVGMRGHVYGDMGAYIRTNGGVVPAKAAQFLPGPYRIPNIELDVSMLVTNKTPVGTYRAPGRFEANFFRERLFDMVARDLAIDPVEFRRRNLISEAEMPYSIGILVPYETEAIYDTGDYHAAFDRSLAEIGWSEKQHLQGELVDGRYHGLAVTPFVESGGAGPRENARLVLQADGMIGVYVGSSTLGQGLETVFAQIAADALGLPFERFRVMHGSTTYVHEGFGTYASRAVVMGGSAVLDGATKLLALIREAAAERLGCEVDATRLADDAVHADDGRSVSLADLGAARTIEALGTFSSTRRTYSYGSHAAHVAVDPKSGHVEIIDYVAVEDVGRAINPAIVHGQAIGAVVQGLGGVFLEHLIYDDQGQLLNASLADYLLPTASDFPNVRGVTMELRLAPSNPLGAKGAGEGGMVAVAAVMGNAIAAALGSFGVEPKELPLSPARLWQMIADARQKSDTPLGDRT